MSPPESNTLAFIVWWLFGTICGGVSMAYSYFFLRSVWRRLTLDATLRHHANVLHSIGWKTWMEGDLFFINDRRWCGWARAWYVWVLAWRSYHLQDKTLFMLILDTTAASLTALGWKKIDANGGATHVMYENRTFTGAVARWASQHVVTVRWWLDERRKK